MSKRKAPPGCYWRGPVLWARIKIGGQDIRFSLHTGNADVAARRRKARHDQLVGAARFGEHRHSYQEAVAAWAEWVVDQVSADTAKRYAVSLKQLEPWLLPLFQDEITAAKVGEIVTGRRAQGASVATVRRDLTALSSVLQFSEDQQWRDGNPALAWFRRLRERRDPIALPQAAAIAAASERAPGMLAALVEALRRTGCRLSELTGARWSGFDHARRQLTVIGKRNRRRTIDLEPMGAYQLFAELPRFIGSPFIFWHDDGQPYKNASSRLAAIIGAAVADAKEAGRKLEAFRIHDLRHLHAVDWLKEGRNIYDLQLRLGHRSIKTTELYLEFLTPDERRTVMHGPHGGELQGARSA